MRSNVYGKPIAWQLFVIVINKDTAHFCNYFKGKTGRIHVYNTKEITYDVDSVDNFSRKLKSIEQESKTDLNSIDSNFCFLTNVQEFETLFDNKQ